MLCPEISFRQGNFFSSDQPYLCKLENRYRKVKVKSLYLTSVVPSATRLVSMEADGAPFTPLPLSVLRFKEI